MTAEHPLKRGKIRRFYLLKKLQKEQYLISLSESVSVISTVLPHLNCASCVSHTDTLLVYDWLKILLNANWLVVPDCSSQQQNLAKATTNSLVREKKQLFIYKLCILS